MLRVPTSRKRRKPDEKLNLVPIMDSIFIFIFFLLMSASFLKIFEIGSDVPIISSAEPPPKEEDPLALTLIAEANELKITTGTPGRIVKTFTRDNAGAFNFEELHAFMIDMKKRHLSEETIIFQPEGDLTYDEIVKIMDAVRMLKRTDEALFRKNREGIDERLETLFSKIIFNNLTS